MVRAAANSSATCIRCGKDDIAAASAASARHARPRCRPLALAACNACSPERRGGFNSWGASRCLLAPRKVPELAKVHSGRGLAGYVTVALKITPAPHHAPPSQRCGLKRLSGRPSDVTASPRQTHTRATRRHSRQRDFERALRESTAIADRIREAIADAPPKLVMLALSDLLQEHLTSLVMAEPDSI